MSTVKVNVDVELNSNVLAVRHTIGHFPFVVTTGKLYGENCPKKLLNRKITVPPAG